MQTKQHSDMHTQTPQQKRAIAYYNAKFAKLGYTCIDGVWYYDKEGKYKVYNTSA